MSATRVVASRPERAIRLRCASPATSTSAKFCPRSCVTSRPAFSRRPIFDVVAAHADERDGREVLGRRDVDERDPQARRAVGSGAAAGDEVDALAGACPRLDDLVGAEALRGGEVTAAGRVTRDQVPVAARRAQAGGDEARHRGDVARARDAALRGRRRGAVVARCSGRDEAARHGWKRRGARGLGGGGAHTAEGWGSDGDDGEARECRRPEHVLSNATDWKTLR